VENWRPKTGHEGSFFAENRPQNFLNIPFEEGFFNGLSGLRHRVLALSAFLYLAQYVFSCWLTAGADYQGMYSIGPIHWNIKFAPMSPGRNRVLPALYVFSLLGLRWVMSECIK
jgi:hypothetical protein